jgi:hypothetical protein
VRAAAVIAAALLAAPPARAQDASTDAGAEAPPVRAVTPLEEIPAERRPTIESWIEGDDRVALGHTLTLRVVIRHRPGDRIHLPADTSFGDLHLVDKELETRRTEEGLAVDDYEITLLALSPGEAELPALEFGGVLEGGEAVRLATPARHVSVTDPTADAESDEPRDIAPVVDVYQEDYTLLYVGGALLAVVLIVLLVRYIVKNWDRWHPRGPLAPPPPRPPDEVAYEKLARLREGGFPESGAKKQWYVDLSEVVREYIGARYGFDGLESTTEEIVGIMRGRKTAGLTQAELFSFLNDCDLVKFAKHEPDEEEDGRALDEAYRIVEVTTRHLAPPEDEPGDERRRDGS